MTQIAAAHFVSLRLGRLGVTQATFAGAFAILTGGISALQFGFGLSRFGGLEYALRLISINSVRELGPATSVSAALFALLSWTHRMDPDAVRSNLWRASPQTFLIAIIGVFATTALAVCSGLCVAHWVYDVPWNALATACSVLSLEDVPAAIEAFALNAALAGAFCWFALPVMRRRSWSLAQKVGTAWAGHILVWLVIEIVGVAIEFASQSMQ